MKQVQLIFPDGKVFMVEWDFINDRYLSLESRKTGIPKDDLPSITAANVNIEAWVRRNLTWSDLQDVAVYVEELDQNGKNRLNFPNVEVKVFDS